MTVYDDSTCCCCRCKQYGEHCYAQDIGVQQTGPYHRQNLGSRKSCASNGHLVRLNAHPKYSLWQEIGSSWEQAPPWVEHFRGSHSAVGREAAAYEEKLEI